MLVYPTNATKPAVAQPALVSQRIVGRWTVHSCLACDQITHAVLNDKQIGPNITLLPKSTHVSSP
jgi:hypothetical protein